MNKKRATILILALVLGGLLTGWYIRERMEANAYTRQQNRRMAYEQEADALMTKVADAYCSGDCEQILALTGGENPASSFLLPEGLTLEYVGRKQHYYVWENDAGALATYVVKYRVTGELPGDLGVNMTRDDIEMDGETPYLFQTASVITDEAGGWYLQLVTYGQYTFEG